MFRALHALFKRQHKGRIRVARAEDQTVQRTAETGQHISKAVDQVLNAVFGVLRNACDIDAFAVCGYLRADCLDFLKGVRGFFFGHGLGICKGGAVGAFQQKTAQQAFF